VASGNQLLHRSVTNLLSWPLRSLLILSARSYVSVPGEVYRVKEQKQRPEGVNETLKFFSKLSTAVLKSILKRHTNKSYENSSHQELRDPKDAPQITRSSTQKTELESETERARNGSQQHRLRTAYSPLQYYTVPRTVRRSKKTETNFV
jgi:putative heme degradation protein